VSLIIESPSPFISPEEWEELQALRKAISQSPASVVPSKQERFASLFARSLAGKGDPAFPL
jgi:hypothetical protein